MANQMYQVGGITGKKEESGQVFYKVHWAGYSSDQDTWEPQSNLANCKLLLDMFNAKQERRVTRSSSKSRDLSSDVEDCQEESRRMTRSLSKSREVIFSSSDDELDHAPPKSKSAHQKRYQGLRSGMKHEKGVNDIFTTIGVHTPPSKIPPTKKAVTSPNRRRRKVITTDDLTPSRYYLRYSTLKQRPPLHSVLSNSTLFEETANTDTKQRKIELQEEENVTSAISMPISSVHHHPSWMNLGMAEMVLCLVILALVIMFLWYLQYHLKTTSFSTKL